MLKKAGIVVAAATAGLLALSPLAFAHEKGDHKEMGKESHSVSEPTVVENTVINEETTSRSPECDFSAAADNSVDQEGTGGSSLLGLGGLVANVAAPINAQTQAPIASCNNIEDVLNTNIEDNLQDNDQDNDETSTDVEDSFNTED